MDPWGTSVGLRAEFVPSLLDRFCPTPPVIVVGLYFGLCWLF